jgi:hypothetical protein
MNVYRLTRPALITLEIVADSTEEAERIADNTARAEHYPEVDLEEGDLDGAGRVTLLSVAPPPEHVAR